MEIQSNAGLSSATMASEKSTGAPAVVAATRSVAEPVQKEAAVQQPGAIPKLEQVKKAVDDINKAPQLQGQNIEFTIDEDTNRQVVKIVDRQTQEVLRQIPTEEALAIAKSLDQVQGLLIRQKA